MENGAVILEIYRHNLHSNLSKLQVMEFLDIPIIMCFKQVLPPKVLLKLFPSEIPFIYSFFILEVFPQFIDSIFHVPRIFLYTKVLL